MRNQYFVCYDVADPKRLARTYKKMQGYGEPVQYSIFMCELNDKEIIIMKKDLGEILNLAEDRLLLINMGSPEKSTKNVSFMGLTLQMQREASIVI